MFLAFVISYFLLADFSSVSARKIVTKPDTGNRNARASEHDDDKTDILKNNAHHPVLKHLHQIYNTDLQTKDADLNQLLLLKQQYIARNHIEEFEIDFGLNFVPDWSKVDRWSSTAVQGIEIRRQKWEYILRNHSDVPLVQTLTNELAKFGVNQSAFCSEIAQAYFILSHNSYIYNKGPSPNEKGHKVTELVHHPVMDKSLKVLMRSIPDSEFKFNETEDLVKIPKSVYHKLLRKDAQITLLKKHHESEIKRKKDNSNSDSEGHKNVRRDSETSEEHDQSESEETTSAPQTTTEEATTEEATTTTTTTTTTTSTSTTEGYDSVLNSSTSSDQGTSDSSNDDDDDGDDGDDTSSSWEWSDTS